MDRGRKMLLKTKMDEESGQTGKKQGDGDRIYKIEVRCGK